MSMVFRERDGVCIQYHVSGLNDSDEQPYVNGLTSLKEAVAIARGYKDTCGTGYATTIKRSYAKRCPEGSGYHHSEGLTHCWEVTREWRLRLQQAYNRWGQPPSKIGWAEYVRSLPLPPRNLRSTTLDQQLFDLEMIAHRLGMREAVHYMFNERLKRIALRNESEAPNDFRPREVQQDLGLPKATGFWTKVFNWLALKQPSHLRAGN